MDLFTRIGALVILLIGGGLTLYSQLHLAHTLPLHLKALDGFTDFSRASLPSEFRPDGMDLPPWQGFQSSDLAQTRFDTATNQNTLDRMSGFTDPYLQSPFLRLRTVQHTAYISRIAMDQSQRILVSGGDDKTVRVWSLPQTASEKPRLLRILRVPIDKGPVGQIYAVAISPNGKLVVAGGWTGHGRGSMSLFFFARETGRIVGHFGRFNNVVTELEFSPDGRYLAIGQGGRQGLLIFSVSDLKLVASDFSYTKEILGLSFNPSNGQLATTSYDGYVRLYRNLQTLAWNGAADVKVQAPQGYSPFSIAHSPDGKEIAIGYNDSAAVSIVSADDLSFIHSPDSSGIDVGNVGAVAWSSNGEFLYAGGRWDDAEGYNPIRRWSRKGRGRPIDIRTARGTVVDIEAWRESGMIFGSYDPLLAGYDGEANKVFEIKSDQSDMRGEGIRVSEDGLQVFSPAFSKSDESSFGFDLRNRALISKDPGNTFGETVLTPGISVTNWENRRGTMLNGQLLDLAVGETSRSLAISPDAETFALGTEFNVRLFDKSGNLRWKVNAPSAVWRVNISRDGRLVVAGIGDGTIRWYSLETGKELLALFVPVDQKRWVLWTPEGYFDASPGGDDLLGWHVNQGIAGTPLFYNVSRFKDVLYRPDIVSRAIDDDLTNKPDRAPTFDPKSQYFPPVVRAIEVQKVQENSVRVSFSVESPSGREVDDIRFLIDGRLQRDVAQTFVNPSRGIQSADLFCTDKDRQLVISAKTQESDYGEAEIVDIAGVCEAPAAEERALYALIIGVSNYANSNISDLSFSDDDANDVAELLRLQDQLGYYDEVNIRQLVDLEATKNEIKEALAWLREQPSENDVSLLYIAGHGQNEFLPSQKETEIPAGTYYFIPYDGDIDRLERTAISYQDIDTYVSNALGHKLLFLDTCYSGQVDSDGLLNRLASNEKGTIVFASSTGKQLSLESADWQNGAFTEAFLSGIDGEADNPRRPDGLITHFELSVHLDSEVRFLTGGRQTPVSRTSVALPATTVAATSRPSN